MTKGQIRRMLMDVIEQLDYDHYYYFVEDTSEDFDEAELLMEDLINVVQEHMSGSK